MIRMMQEMGGSAGGRHVPRHEFLRTTGFSERQVNMLFGSYNDLVHEAGLEPRHFPRSGVRQFSDDELLEEVVRVLHLPDAKFTRVFFEQNAQVSTSVCERRFGGWLGTLRAARAKLNNEDDTTLLEKLDASAQAPDGRRPAGAQPPYDGDVPPDSNQSALGPRNDRLPAVSMLANTPNVYGDFINFRGLQHAPVNEQGVVLLFGMICRELGYVVEAVRSGFPDCEAKRAINGRAQQWQRVRIEFEYQSRNFNTHGHDPDLCDVIVCWEHNWPTCPLEVVELRVALSSLKREG